MVGGMSHIRPTDVVLASEGVQGAKTGGLRQTSISPTVAASPQDNRQLSTNRLPNL